MKASAVSLCLLTSSVLGSPLVGRATNANPRVSDAQYAQVVDYTRFAAAALTTGCKTLYGATVISYVANTETDTQGYVARSDSRSEIIVSLRGTSSIVDVVTDSRTDLVACTGTGITYPAGSLCHDGFMSSYNSVQDQIISLVTGQVAAYPKYNLTVVGHSLGGGLASFGALSMRKNFPNTTVKGFSFGQPRSGNRAYANFHDASLRLADGNPAFFRGIHTTDGVPQVIRQGSQGQVVETSAGLVLPLNNPKATSGYWHHGIEVWQFQEPATSQDTVRCSGQENPTCQDSLYIFAPLLGINQQHLTYFGQDMTNTACPAS